MDKLSQNAYQISLDLPAIELIWSIVKGMLSMFPLKDINELKSAIINNWDSIPLSICQRIIEHKKKMGTMH